MLGSLPDHGEIGGEASRVARFVHRSGFRSRSNYGEKKQIVF